MLLDWFFFGSRSASQRVAAPSPRQGKIEAMEQFPFHLGGGGERVRLHVGQRWAWNHRIVNHLAMGRSSISNENSQSRRFVFLFFFSLAMSFIVRVDLINFQTGCLKSPPTSHTRGHLIISYCSRLFCDVSAKDSKI